MDFVAELVHKLFERAIFFAGDNLADAQVPAISQLLSANENFIAPIDPRFFAGSQWKCGSPLCRG